MGFQTGRASTFAESKSRMSWPALRPNSFSSIKKQLNQRVCRESIAPVEAATGPLFATVEYPELPLEPLASNARLSNTEVRFAAFDSGWGVSPGISLNVWQYC